MKLVKTFFVIAALIISCSIVSAAAASSSSLANLSSAYKKTILNKIEFPQEAKLNNIEGVVRTRFMVTDTGRIVVTGINGAPELVKSLQKQLEKIQVVPEEGLVNVEFYIYFNFEIQ